MTPRRARSFTLVEVVVVIALIVLLSALVLGVGTAVVKSAETRQTTLLLTQLEAAAREWRVQADRDIELDAYEPTAQTLANDTLEDPEEPGSLGSLSLYRNKYFHLLQRPAAMREMVAKISPDLVRPNNTFTDPAEPGHNLETLRVVDAWDTGVLVVLCGRSWVQGGDPPADRDQDGTIRTPLERRLGTARNRQTYFVSAGPDGRFGDVSAAAGSENFERTRDNIYSYQP